MVRLVLLLALAGAAYWYWTGPYQRANVADETQANAAIMQQCMQREQRMEATGNLAGLGGVGATTEDAQRLCANKNHLYMRDGKWYLRAD